MNSKKIYFNILFIFQNILYQARHVFFITIIIVLIIKLLVLVPIERDQLRAVTELHVGVAEDRKALEEDLLAGDLLLAWHLADLTERENISFASRCYFVVLGGVHYTGNSFMIFSLEMHRI